MHHLHHLEITLERLRKFADYGKWRARFYPQRAPVMLSVYSAPDRIAYAEALHGDFRPAQVGDRFGPAWSTHWFKVEIEIPHSWAGREVHLLWDSSSEACVWVDCKPRQGLTGFERNRLPIRSAYRIAQSAQAGEKRTVYIEMACNTLWGYDERINPAVGLLKQAEIAIFDRQAWEFYWDFIIVAEMAQHLPQTTPRGGQALFAANQMLNLFEPDDPATWQAARKVAADFLAARNGDGQHNMSAIGHAHIDTAWLWPLAETRRKCIRTFASTLRLMEDYPEYRFACSQAQQLEWIRQAQPEMFDEIKVRVGEGRFVPVGGMWVEPDLNIPSGESLVRQLLYGQRFFREHFGVLCGEFWCPDTFGYSAAMPQILRGAGIRSGLTTKLSWNQFNKPLHSTFWWEGLDGSRILMHLPPADSYNSECEVQEVLKALANFKEHAQARESYYLFGHGDGGGGPTPEMIERLRRMHDVDGLPRIEIRTAKDFFARCEADAKALTTWAGELYFELHRGTYTTHARSKQANRRAEQMLHDVEFLATVASVQNAAYTYPRQEIERLWKLVLLNQFHDIVTGTSIREVYEESAAQYEDVQTSGAALIDEALEALFPTPKDGSAPTHLLALDTVGQSDVFGREMVVIELPIELPAEAEPPQRAANGRPLVIVAAQGMAASFQALSSLAHADFPPVEWSESGDTIIFQNHLIKATIGRDGTLLSLRTDGTEFIAPGAAANRFVLYGDQPNNWPAWDVDIFHLQKRREIGPARLARIKEGGPLRAMIEFEYEISPLSTLKQTIALDCASAQLEMSCTVDWHEHEKFLKVEFPLNLRAEHAAYETQFGYVQRPTHFNTPYDLARFEVCAQRWACLHDAERGVILMNDGKYGHAVHGNVMSLSLLRSPTWPDAQADRGQHAFRFALAPYEGAFSPSFATDLARWFNAPLRLRAAGDPGALPVAPFFRCSRAVLDTIKRAEDTKAIIARCYEPSGAHGKARLESALPISAVTRCNLLEEDQETLRWEDGGVSFEVRPFEIVTLKLALQQ